MNTRTKADIEYDKNLIQRVAEEGLKNKKVAFEYLYYAGIINKNGKLRARYK